MHSIGKHPQYTMPAPRRQTLSARRGGAAAGKGGKTAEKAFFCPLPPCKNRVLYYNKKHTTPRRSVRAPRKEKGVYC